MARRQKHKLVAPGLDGAPSPSPSAPSPSSGDGKRVHWREQWATYVADVERRLRSGQREYGDESFSADPRRLLQELQQELLDVSGWGFVLWHRLERMRQCLEGAKLPPVDKDVEL